MKPKQMVGLFPLDLRSELKQRIGGGKAGFALKKSSTNIDVSNKAHSEAIPLRISGKLNDLLNMETTKKSNCDDDDDDDAGVDKLSFKEKLQLIERSSSRNAVNLL